MRVRWRQLPMSITSAALHRANAACAITSIVLGRQMHCRFRHPAKACDPIEPHVEVARVLGHVVEEGPFVPEILERHPEHVFVRAEDARDAFRVVNVRHRPEGWRCKSWCAAAC